MDSKQILSVGIDIGTSTSQLVFSRLELRNRAAACQIPRFEITDRRIVWQSPVAFTPLTDVDTLDITNRHEVAAYVRHHAPDAIISCAAFTNVDGCETNREAAFAVNALGARNLAMAAEEIGAKLVHVSTDYVFSGDAAQPVWEYDLPAPRSVYGKTKLLGEQYVQQFCTHYFIVRTAWLYGYAGNNFVKTMLRLARQNGGVTVVDDQLGNPTNAADLAHEILNLLVTKEYGVYHCTGEGVCSWCEFAAFPASPPR